MTSRQVWITGARGFIGRHLAARLSAGGDQVVGLGHGAFPDAAEWGLSHWLNGEISAENLSQLLRTRSAEPEIVYHLAGGSSVGAALAAPREDFHRTVETTATLCEWLRLEAPTARLVAISSAAVYGAGHAGPIPEPAAGRPFSLYGHHKLMMEQVCRAYADGFGLPVAIARLFSVYGAGLEKQLLWDACARLASGADVLELGGTGRERRDWIEVRDVVRALQLIGPLASEQAPVLNVGTGCGTSIADVAALLTRAWGGAAPVRFSGRGRPGDPESLVAETARLDALGFSPDIELDAGIAAYVAWRKARP